MGRDTRKSNITGPSIQANDPVKEIKIIEVESLFIGGGPATLGILSNAYQTNRLDELIRGVHSTKNTNMVNDLLSDKQY